MRCGGMNTRPGWLHRMHIRWESFLKIWSMKETLYCGMHFFMWLLPSRIIRSVCKYFTSWFQLLLFFSSDGMLHFQSFKRYCCHSGTIHFLNTIWLAGLMVWGCYWWLFFAFFTKTGKKIFSGLLPYFFSWPMTRFLVWSLRLVLRNHPLWKSFPG